MRTLIALAVILAGCTDDVQGIPGEDGMGVLVDARMPFSDGLVLSPDARSALDASDGKDAALAPDGAVKDAEIPQRDAKSDKPDVEQSQPDGMVVEPDAPLPPDAAEEPDAALNPDAGILVLDAEVLALDAVTIQSDAAQSVPDVEVMQPDAVSAPDAGVSLPPWVPVNVDSAPSPRFLHTAVWTGSEMIVWGGVTPDDPPCTNTGGRYNPETDTWVSTSLENAPFARFGGHTAIWTGSEMIVWGGTDASGPIPGTNTGARYNPTTDTWISTSTETAPAARQAHTAVWTGSEMIVWGGYEYHPETTSYELFSSGGRYNPTTDTWTLFETTGAPEGRVVNSAVWTGSEMIVWGGYTNLDPGDQTVSGGRYNPTTNSWAETSIFGAPSMRQSYIAIWTGSEMIVWGGCATNECEDLLHTGGRYNPTTDVWTATSVIESPGILPPFSVVWTGSEMIVWGGWQDCSDGSCEIVVPGGRYNPITDMWVATPTFTIEWNLREHRWHTAIWTGSEMIVWGGAHSAGLTNTGGRYRP